MAGKLIEKSLCECENWKFAEACVKFAWDSLHEMTFKVKLKEDLLYDLHSLKI